MMTCGEYRKRLPDMLFGAEGNSAESKELAAHAAACAACAEELAQLRATMALLGEWEAPEPTPYFDTRMAARLREARNAAPAGFFERMRERLLFGSSMNLRPVMAGALALVLMVAGGTYEGMGHGMHPAGQEQASAAVGDLQSLDRNAQTIDQMDQLVQDGQDDRGAGANPQLNP